MDYPVRFGEESVGKVQVSRQGLYYHVVCRCALTGNTMYRLEAFSGEKRVDLGILVPMDFGFGLQTKFPVSRLGEGALQFCIRLKHETAPGRHFVPIIPEEPFSYLERLKDAFLDIQDGKKGASLPEARKERFPG